MNAQPRTRRQWALLAAALCFAPASEASEVRAIAYFHGPMEHYFMSADPAEIAWLDSTAPATRFVTQSFNDAWTSETGWDPLADAYALDGGSGFEGPSVRHVAYQFDRIDASSAPVCAHVVWWNPHHAMAAGHPFQHVLWSACESGTMTRIQP